jgi:hypothetical protein
MMNDAAVGAVADVPDLISPSMKQMDGVAVVVDPEQIVGVDYDVTVNSPQIVGWVVDWIAAAVAAAVAVAECIHTVSC